MKNDIKKLEEKLKSMDFSTNNEYMEQLENQLKHKIGKNTIAFETFINESKKKSDIDKHIVIILCSLVTLFLLLISTDGLQSTLSRISSIF